MRQPRLLPFTETHTVTFFGPTDELVFTEGDVLLFATDGAVATGIRAGEWLISRISEPELRPYTWANHAAVGRFARAVDTMADGTKVPEGTPIVAQMSPRGLGSGHEYVPAHGYVHRLAAVVHFDADANDVKRTLHRDDNCAFVRYGFLAYPGLFINGLTGLKLGLAPGASLFCSEHTTLCAADYYFPDRPASAVTPAHIAMYVDAKPPAELWPPTCSAQ